MTGPWFFAPPACWRGGLIELPEDEGRHATKVLRLHEDSEVTVTDGQGMVATGRLKGQGLSAFVEVVASERATEPRPNLVVYQGEAKGTKLDDVVERLAELGVAEVWSFSSERSVVKWDQLKQKRLEERWRQISRSAAKQSRHPYFLQPRTGLTFDALVERVEQEPFALTLWEEASLPLRAALGPVADRLAVVIGPEGGLTSEEAERLADAGAPLVSLGPHILRTENAPVVTAAALLYHHGLIG